MDLSAYFDYPKVRFDKDNEVVLCTRLKAPSVDNDDRQPLNLVACLDISGSMGGQKIERMKKTVQVLIDHMTEQDKLGIVIFSSNYTKLASCQQMTCDRKDELRRRVAKLRATNSTNISGAMLLSFEILGVRENDLNRVLLLTDGLPNEGETTIPGLVSLVGNRPKNVSLSTIGFGTDHNPELLQSMANAGNGNYYFIENADQISSAFAQELGGLISCFAQNVKIEATFKPGVSDVDVINKAWEWEFDEEKLTVRVPELIAEESKHILIKVALDKRSSSLPRGVTVADVKVSYTNLVDKKDETIEEKAKIEFVKKGEESQERDEEIAKQEARLKAAQAQEEAVKLANNGQYAEARELLTNGALCLSDAGDTEWAEELERVAEDFQSHTYSANVGFKARRYGYSVGRGKAAGAVYGCSAQSLSNTAQKNLMRSFKQETGEPDEEEEKKPVSNEHLAKMAKKYKEDKKKKKKYNPMTD
jgi:Ca-activated chloride channel family protein